MSPEEISKRNSDLFTWLYPDAMHRAIMTYATMFYKYGIYMRCTESLRSTDRQRTLYLQGRMTPGKIVTWSLPGSSMHEYGVAFDSCFAGYDVEYVAKLRTSDEVSANVYLKYLDGSDPYLERLEAIAPTRAQALWQCFGDACKENGVTWGGKFLHPDKPHAQISYGITLASIKDTCQKFGIDAVHKMFDRIAAQWHNVGDSLHN